MAFLRLFLFFIARACLSSIFLMAAIGHVMNWEGAEQDFSNSLYLVAENTTHISWLNTLLEMMMPISSILLMVGVGLMGIGALLVLFGVKARLGAIFLILFLIPATGIMHHFWLLQGPDQVREMAHFMKNISILGGLLLLILHPSLKKAAPSFSDDD